MTDKQTQVLNQALHDMSNPIYADWEPAEAFLDVLPTSWDVVEKGEAAAAAQADADRLAEALRRLIQQWESGAPMDKEPCREALRLHDEATR